MDSKKLKIYFLNLFALLAFSSLFCITNGIINILAGMLVSVIIGKSVTKYHYWYVGLLCLFSFVIISLFYGILQAFLPSIVLIMLGLTLGISTNIGLSYYFTVMVCSAIYLVETIINLKIIDKVTPNGESYGAILRQAGENAAAILGQQYGQSQEILRAIDETIDAMMSLTFTLTPAVFVAVCLASAGVLVMIYKKVQLKSKTDVSHLCPFSMLRGDKVIGFLFLIVISIAMLSSEGLITDLCLNVIVILCFVFFIFGLAYIEYVMKSRGYNILSRRLTVLIAIPLLSLFFIFPVIIVIGIGVSDSLIDLRARLLKKENHDGPQ